MAAFSSNDVDVISRKLSVSGDVPCQMHDDMLASYFELPRCISWLTDNNFHQVALQFPDNLLVHSARVAQNIESKTDTRVAVLADTSYGSCCVDEVAAEHFQADCIIHFGHSCLSPTKRLPVLYVFCSSPINSSQFVSQFTNASLNDGRPVILWYDVIYHHEIESIQKLLQDCSVDVLIPVLDNESDTVEADNKCIIRHCGRTVRLPENRNIDNYTICYIGYENDTTLLNLVLNFRKNPIYVYVVCKDQLLPLSLNVNKMLMRRFHLIERTKDAQIIGILVGTLGVAKYLSAIEQIKQTIKAAGKKYYVFAVGKVNMMKLANFVEIDMYVLVACPENSLIDSKEFYRPIVTPFELDVACNEAREWTGDYINDFSLLLPGCSSHVPLTSNGEERYDVSLISGGMRSLGIRQETDDKTTSNTLQKRDGVTTVAQMHQGSAGGFLASRSWQGLEQKLGETEVTEARQGRSGIAMQYDSEPT